MKITITKKIENRIKLADNTGNLKNATADEIKVLVEIGMTLFIKNDRNWGNIDGFGITEKEFRAISAFTLYKLAIDEENYKLHEANNVK